MRWPRAIHWLHALVTGLAIQELCFGAPSYSSGQSSSIAVLSSTYMPSAGARNLPLNGTVVVHANTGWIIAAAGSTAPGYFTGLPVFGLYNVGSGNLGQANVGYNNIGFGNYGTGNIGRLNTGTSNIGYLNIGTSNIGALDVSSYVIGDNIAGASGSIGYNISASTLGNVGINITGGNYNVGWNISGTSNAGANLVGTQLIGLNSTGSLHVGVNNTNGDTTPVAGCIGFNNDGDGCIGQTNNGTALIGVNNTGNGNIGYLNDGVYQLGFNLTAAYNTTDGDVTNIQIGYNQTGFNNIGILVNGTGNIGCSIDGNSNTGCDITGDSTISPGTELDPIFPDYPYSTNYAFPAISLVGSSFNSIPTTEEVLNTAAAAAAGFNATATAVYWVDLSEPALLSVVDLGCPGELISVSNGNSLILTTFVPTGGSSGPYDTCDFNSTVSDPAEALSDFNYSRGYVSLPAGQYYLVFDVANAGSGAPSAGTALAFRIDTYTAQSCTKACPLPVPFIDGTIVDPKLFTKQPALEIHGLKWRCAQNETETGTEAGTTDSTTELSSSSSTGSSSSDSSIEDFDSDASASTSSSTATSATTSTSTSTSTSTATATCSCLDANNNLPLESWTNGTHYYDENDETPSISASASASASKSKPKSHQPRVKNSKPRRKDASSASSASKPKTVAVCRRGESHSDPARLFTCARSAAKS